MKPSHKERNEEKEKIDNVKSEEREELDFQFDEELDTPPPTGRHNAFSEWFVAICLTFFWLYYEFYTCVHNLRVYSIHKK